MPADIQAALSHFESIANSRKGDWVVLTEQEYRQSVLGTDNGLLHAMRVAINTQLGLPCSSKAIMDFQVITSMIKQLERKSIGSRSLTDKQLSYARSIMTGSLQGHVMAAINGAESTTTFVEEAEAEELVRVEKTYGDNPLWGSF